MSDHAAAGAGAPESAGILGILAALFAAGLLALLLLLYLPIAIVTGLFGGGGGDSATPIAAAPGGAGPFLEMYADAALQFHVSPFVLMALHATESSFSANVPSVHTGHNEANAAGPMQFLIDPASATPAIGGSGATWEGYRNAIDEAKRARPESDYPGKVPADAPHPNVYDSYDAIYAAAALMQELGAGPAIDDRTMTALERYKGTPPWSTPYAQATYNLALSYAAASADARPAPGTPLAPSSAEDGSVGVCPIEGICTDPGNLPGRPLRPELMGFLQRVATAAGRKLYVSYGTAGEHSDGSDHYTGLAADFGSVANKFPSGGGGFGDTIAVAGLVAAGVEPAEATRLALAGGGHNVCVGGWRVQVIWRTGGHFNHVHIGLAQGCDFEGVRNFQI